MATTTTPVDTTQDTSATTSVPPTETEAPETDPTTTTPQTTPQTTTDGSGNFPRKCLNLENQTSLLTQSPTLPKTIFKHIKAKNAS